MRNLYRAAGSLCLVACVAACLAGSLAGCGTSGQLLTQLPINESPAASTTAVSSSAPAHPPATNPPPASHPAPATTARAPATTAVAPTVSAVSAVPAVPTVPPQTVTASVPPTTLVSAVPACITPELTVGSAGPARMNGTTAVATFHVVNDSGAACAMTGEPNISVFGKQPQGSPGGSGGTSMVEANLVLSQVSFPAGATSTPGSSAGRVVVAPGQSALFFMGWQGGGSSCLVADGFTFQAPQSDVWSDAIQYPFTVCGGELYVSVMEAPGTGY